MNGVMIPVASAGSNQVGASETCTPQVNSPFGSAPSAGAPATRPSADNSSNWRRSITAALLCGPDSVQSRDAVMMCPSLGLVFVEVCRGSVADSDPDVSDAVQTAPR